MAKSFESFDSKDEVFEKLAAEEGVDYPFISLDADADSFDIQETFVIQKAMAYAWDNRYTQEENINSPSHSSQVFWYKCLSFPLDIFESTD